VDLASGQFYQDLNEIESQNMPKQNTADIQGEFPKGQKQSGRVPKV